MTQPLIPWRRTAIATVLVCIVAVVVGGIAYHDQHHFNTADWHILKWVRDTFSRRFLKDALKITTPSAVTGLVALVAVVAFLRGHKRLALAASIGPVLAFVLTEYVIKPLVGRTVPLIPGLPLVNGTHAYPSGHETGVASLTTVLVIAAFAATTSTALRIAAIVGALAIDLLGCLALVGNYYHFATDTFAAIGVSVASIVGVALLIDSRTISSPDAGALASRARAA